MDMDDSLDRSMDRLEISGSGTFGTDSELEDSLDSLFGHVTHQQNSTREGKLIFKEHMNKVPVLTESIPVSSTPDLRMSRGVNAMTKITTPNVTERPKKKKKGKRVRKDDGKYSDTKYSTADISFSAKSRTLDSKSTSTATSSGKSIDRKTSRNAGAWISSPMDIKNTLGSSISTAGKGYSAKKNDASSSKSQNSKPTEISTQTGGAGGSSRTVRVSEARKRGARVMVKTESRGMDDETNASSAGSSKSDKDQKAKWDSDKRQRNMRQEVLRSELGLSNSSRPRGTGNTATRAVFFM